MSPPRRRSARIASSTKTRLKPPSSARTASASNTLSSLVEHDENPQALPAQSLNAIMSSPMRVPQTPASSTPVKPPRSEMHPSKVHPTMAPPSSAFRLGFTDIKPDEAARGQPSGITQSTPSKSTLPSSSFTFRVAGQSSEVRLGPEAQRMMDELRDQASKIKAELAAKRELERVEGEADGGNGRKIAKAKGKSGRFSAAHLAEFKKMDSIAAHPSVFRAQADRTSPIKTGIKRSQSKASLRDSEPASVTPITFGIKRSQSRANLDDADAASSKRQIPAPSSARSNGNVVSTAKRARQHLEDDASSNRPISRDGSGIPRPTTSGSDTTRIHRSQSSLAHLMTPTKASLARGAPGQTPTASLAKSPSKSSLSNLKKSVTTSNLNAFEKPKGTSLLTPSRLERVKSLFRNKSSSKANSGLPLPATPVSKTPAPKPADKELPPIPLTTPGRKLAIPKRVNFTPDTKRAALSLAAKSPSPVKSGLPRSIAHADVGEVHYPTLDAVIKDTSSDSEPLYPDLSAGRPLPQPPSPSAEGSKKTKSTLHPNVPGTFSFRSDHTIRFGSTSPTGFGGSPGQSSVRHVRKSVMPTDDMPGSFPDNHVSSPDKENDEPASLVRTGIAHGIGNKKRHRASWADEVEEEATERAGKKRKANPIPSGDSLVNSRLTAGATKAPTTPKKSATPSPVKKRAVLSLSRLNMLARPKQRS